MIERFTLTLNPARVVFGRGTISQLPAEIARLACKRALFLSTPFQRAEAEALAAKLGETAVAVFAEAAMHTPVDVTERALEAVSKTGADCVVSYGGGSTIGLGKAIAWRIDMPQIVVATTYAGSEVTHVLGETENGLKSTRRDIRILPETVIYDPDLTFGLPPAMSVASGLNAMAHAVEGLYAQDSNPVTTWYALEGIRTMKEALPRILTTPDDAHARTLALYGSWMCGTVLGTVGMALHHKLCHTLGGSCNLPHAETHAVLLPHTVAYNAVAAAKVLQPVTALFGGSAGGGLHDFASSLGAPVALRDLGLAENELDRASDIAVRNPYWNPRPVERDAIRALLQRAWEGIRPE